jgi:hypothetical protein
LCIALSSSDHALQTRIGSLWRFGVTSGDDDVPKHFSKIRSGWQQQNPAPCTRDDTISLLFEKGLSAYAVCAQFRIRFMFRVIELSLHLDKRWRRFSHRLPRRTSGVSEGQAEHYCKHTYYLCLKRRHFLLSSIPLIFRQMLPACYSETAYGFMVAAERRLSIHCPSSRSRRHPAAKRMTLHTTRHKKRAHTRSMALLCSSERLRLG